MSRLLSRIGEEMRRSAQTGAGDLRQARQRARLVYASENRSRPTVRRFVAGGVVALAAAAALVVGWQVLQQPETLTCYSAEGAPISARTWIDVAPHQPESLRFSDESRVELRANSRARLTRIGHGAVSLALEKGALRASIVSAPERRWHFVAGPYQVTVTGTVLGVEWQPDQRQLAVEVETGTVEVTGGRLRDRTVEVIGGERLVVSRDGRNEESIRLQIVETEEDSPSSFGVTEDRATNDPSTVGASETMEAPSLDEAPPQDEAPLASASPPSAEPGGGIRRLHRHLRARRRRQAVDAAERIGVTAAAESLSASRIAQLAEYLRLEGRPDEAERILLRLRNRYPANPEARRAAFVLGRLALDHTKYDAARRWFQTVLREAPGSPFAEEAFGRLIDVELRAGHSAAARSTATEYLSRYPDGSYRRVAEQLLRRSLNE